MAFSGLLLELRLRDQDGLPSGNRRWRYGRRQRATIATSGERKKGNAWSSEWAPRNSTALPAGVVHCRSGWIACSGNDLRLMPLPRRSAPWCAMKLSRQCPLRTKVCSCRAMPVMPPSSSTRRMEGHDKDDGWRQDQPPTGFPGLQRQRCGLSFWIPIHPVVGATMTVTPTTGCPAAGACARDQACTRAGNGVHAPARRRG